MVWTPLIIESPSVTWRGRRALVFATQAADARARRPRHIRKRFRTSSLRAVDPPAAQDDVAMIQHDRLAWRNGALRVGKGDAQLVVCFTRNASGLRLVVVADLSGAG